MKTRRPLPVTAVVAVVAAVGLGACTSNPSPRAVVNDVIESLEGVGQEAKDCMLDVVEGYTDDELEQMGADNVNFNSAAGNLEDTTPEFQEFDAALRACTADG